MVEQRTSDGSDTFEAMVARSRTLIRRILHFGSMVGIGLSGAQAQSPIDGALPDALTSRTARCCLTVTTTTLVVGTAASFIALDRAWYSGYDRSPFHFFNDGAEWLQMDKTGHFFSTYTLGSWSNAMLRHCGMQERRARWVGGSVGLVLLTGVEILDGTSAGWGFSAWDMVANVGGASLFIGQDALWGEQRIRPKLSAHLTDFAAQRPDLLGSGLADRILKDYNGLTLWLSGNVNSLTGCDALPPWLNVAVGYGAEGMITAMEPTYPETSPANERWYRQFYLSPDIDLTRVKTRSKALRTVFFVLNSIKIPAPALEVRSTGKVVGHWLYF